MIRAYRISVAVVSFFLSGVLGIVFALGSFLPDHYYVAQGQRLILPNLWGIRAQGWADRMPDELLCQAGNRYSTTLSLWGGPVIKTVSVQVVEREMVIPAGTPFGVKMFTEGVMVVGMSDLDIKGKAVNPAKQAGIRTGDIILSVAGKTVSTNEEVGAIVTASGGKPLDVRFRRGTQEKTAQLVPVCSPADGSYKAGMWVRDSSAGIGTMTYYDPESQVFAGLGHAICDIDTGTLMPLASGEAVEVTITGVNKGASGFPGELRGIFGSGQVIGSLIHNDETGIYGRCSYSPAQNQPVPMALKTEVKPGPASIYTTVEGKSPKSYQIEIERVAASDANPTKNMVIRITDANLLAVTGGIVQGMSGSPILQDGKLVGAVTHVFVNDPTRGYAIFAENMKCEANRQNGAEKQAA